MINISKGLRNILVGAAFVLTIILIYADSLNPKVSKEIPKKVLVFNNTEYDVEFKPKGILFYDITLPEEKTTIPIQNQVYELIVPENKHIT